MRPGPAIERKAMAVKSPRKCRIIAEPARIGEFNEMEAELFVGRICAPESLGTAKIGEAGINAHASARRDDQCVRFLNDFCSFLDRFLHEQSTHVSRFADFVLSHRRR